MVTNIHFFISLATNPLAQKYVLLQIHENIYSDHRENLSYLE